MRIVEPLRQPGGEVFTDAYVVNSEARLDFPAEHRASRVLGNEVMPEMVRLVGEGMLWRVRHADLAYALMF